MDTGALDVVKLVDFESMVTAVLGTSLSELGSILDMLAPAETDGTVASVLLHVQNTMQEEGVAAMAPVVLDVVSDNAFVQTMLVQAVQLSDRRGAHSTGGGTACHPEHENSGYDRFRA